VLENIDACKATLGGLKPVLPVASGGLHPRLVPALLETFGNDVVIQAGGGIHGHPDGTVAGAKAMRQAVDASLKGISLEEYAKTHKELKAALEQWKA
jgi:ribulose-bisphosphate carboxylase large chain